MGQRCNLVIVENAKATLYYDHWAANSLDVELFWGPNIARAFVESRQAEPASWLDEIWSEGGCVIDFDTRHLLWYGGEDILYCPAENLAHHTLMQSQWPDWQVEWAKDGIFDLAAKLGLPQHIVFSGTVEEPQKMRPARAETSDTATFLLAEGIVSCHADGKLGFAVVDSDADCCLHPDLTRHSVEDFISSFRLTEFLENKALDQDWSGFTWGAHFDFDACRVDYWSPSPVEGLPARMKKRWHGFDLCFHGPNHLWHTEILPELDWLKPDDRLKKKRLAHIRSQLARSDENPGLRVIQALQERKPGLDIQMNDSILHHRAHRSADADKQAILDRLERSLLGPSA